MRKFHLALVVAAGLSGCEAATTTVDRNDLSDSSANASEPCPEDLPPQTIWDGKLRAPLPPPQSAESTVQIYDDPEDPKRRWAFSTDGGKITSWLVFPDSAVGALVQQAQEPVQQLYNESSGAKTSVVKVRPPKGPRLAAFVTSAAYRQLRVEADAAKDADECADEDDK